MLKTNTVDTRSGNSLRIEEDGATNVYVVPKPSSLDQQTLPYVNYLKLDGTGTTSMLVDGSVTPQDFHIKAQSYDVYVNTLVFTISDAGSNLNQFGALAALTNGLEFYYFNQEAGKYTIEEGLKTNFDFIRLSNFEPSFGNATTAMQLLNVTGASEAHVGVIDFEDIFGMQWGLKLRANTTDKIGFIVKDNISTIDAMNIKVYGLRT